MTSSRWLTLRVEVPPDETASALLAEGLLELGGRAVWEKDGHLVTHVPEPGDLDDFLRVAEARLGDLKTAWQPHEEWAETWKRGLTSRRITDRLVVTPSWIHPEVGPGDVLITVDPEMAFGNAEHGTTRGCLRLLDEALLGGERVLDVGTGSGILSIAARCLGASEVVALDGDPLACESTRANLLRNGVSQGVTVTEIWASAESLSGLGTFDGVVANLESGILSGLMPGLEGCVREGGWLILSGILAPELEGVLEGSSRRDRTVEAVDEDGDWRSVRLRWGA